MADNVLVLTDANWSDEVLKSDKPVLVDFWAPWCGPCRKLSESIELLAKEYEGLVKVGKMNTDENSEIPGSLKISAIPTVLFYNQGVVADRLVGVNPLPKFREALSKLGVASPKA